MTSAAMTSAAMTSAAMTSAAIRTDWHTLNQQALQAAIASVRSALERHAKPAGIAADVQRLQLNLTAAIDLLSAALPTSALSQLCHLFGLTPFERDLLLLCAGMELEATWAPLCAAAQGDPQRLYPTFSLVMAALSAPHWSALTPEAPLRRWQLIKLGNSTSFTMAPLRIDESILHYLLGLPHLDEQLIPLLQPARSPDPLVPSHQQIKAQVVQAWAGETQPIVQLCGDDPASQEAIAATACAEMGLTLYTLSYPLIPAQQADLHQFQRLWDRQAKLDRAVLLLDCESPGQTDTAREGAIAHLIESLESPLIVVSRNRRPLPKRSLITFEVNAPTPQEQRSIWQDGLGDRCTDQLNGQVDVLVSQFNLTAPTIRAICATVTPELESKPQLFSTLWNTCRHQARPRLDDLAQPMRSQMTWDDLVLPDDHLAVMRDIAAHVRQRAKVYEQWGFGNKSKRGLGISALFAGASGTGKTFAAEVLANELQLDLYRIDLSCVVSKYIGETEKNLGRIFDAAETGGAILLFDEADALFGKRSEVKDSHDRHANIEVGYLLQRMESYRGLAILTTNLKDAIDSAFLRRIRFTIRFSFPDAVQRAEIWRRVFPPELPTEGLQPEKLARLGVAGGNIRNIALNAAFSAADAGEAVQMKHLLAAARSEYLKLEKPITDSEIKGWVL
jgi:ATPase family associated with various cellular activities (AAA)